MESLIRGTLTHRPDTKNAAANVVQMFVKRTRRATAVLQAIGQAAPKQAQTRQESVPDSPFPGYNLAWGGPCRRRLAMRNAIATAALLAFLFVPATAPAQTIFVPYLSAGDVQEIAAQNGVAEFYRVRLDEGVWKIEGRDLNGRYVYVRIDPRTGQIVRFDRGW
jgi:hypothetical protein